MNKADVPLAGNDESAHDYFGLRIPFLEYCGIRGVARGEGWTVSEVVLGPHMTNSMGTGHGGLIMTLLDVAMGSASRLSEPASRGVLTVDLHTSFIRPARDWVQCRAEVTSRTARTVFCEAWVKDRDDVLVAKGMGTFKLVFGDRGSDA